MHSKNEEKKTKKCPVLNQNNQNTVLWYLGNYGYHVVLLSLDTGESPLAKYLVSKSTWLVGAVPNQNMMFHAHTQTTYIT